MTKDKWTILYNESCDTAQLKANKFEIIPEQWNQLRAVYMELIHEIDEATEVYNLENKVK